MNQTPCSGSVVVVGDFELAEAGSLLMKAFEGSEDLLMSPADADKFNAMQSRNEQIQFLNTENPIALADKAPPARVNCGQRKEPPVPNQQKGEVQEFSRGRMAGWSVCWSIRVKAAQVGLVA